VRAISIYLASAIATMVLAKAAVVGIGLPGWVVPGALVALGVALAAMLFTMFVHHRSERARVAERGAAGRKTEHPTLTRLAVQASPWVTWRRTATLGATAVSVIALLAGGYAVTRALGIGPAASLLGTGALMENERILVAEFASASDSTLGPAVTEAFRSDLSQLSAITVVQPNQTRTILARMKLPPTTRLDFNRAREIAVREGIKGVIDGSIVQVGTSYVLTATLYAASAASDTPLATFRSTARTTDDIIAAIGKLSRDVRAKIGESLRSVNAAAPLEQVTTPSLDALRKYAAALRIFNESGNFDQGIRLLEEAVALDTGFAMAYRKLSIELSNQGVSTSRAISAIEKAYAHRDRLSDQERYLTIGGYYSTGPNPDRRKSTEAYETLLELNPRSTVAYNNVANNLRHDRQFARAESLARRGLAMDSANRILYQNVFFAQLSQGNYARAEQTLAALKRRYPDATTVTQSATLMAWSRFQFDSVKYYAELARRIHASESNVQFGAGLTLAGVALVEGRVNDSRTLLAQATDAGVRMGNVAAPLTRAYFESFTESFTLENRQRALRIMDEALVRLPLDSLPIVERPYHAIVASYSSAGAVDRAKAVLADFEKSRRTVKLGSDDVDRPLMLGEIALAEGRYADAVRHFRASDIGFCPSCALPDIARAYDLNGEPDSAVAVFKRYVSTPDADRYYVDPFYLAGAHKRLGELLEARGDRAGAASHYATFLGLWKNADPVLQPRVAQVRASLARLQASERR